MSTGALIAASAAAGRARRNAAVLDAFRLADATAPDRARPLEELGLTQSQEVVALARHRVLVHDAAADTWYLNEAAYITMRDMGPKRAVKLLLVFITITLVIVAVGMVMLIRSRPVPPVTPVPAGAPRLP